MTILISHNSALEWIRAVPPQVNVPPLPTQDVSVPELRRWRGMPDFPSLQALGVMSLPVHLLVSADKHQARTQITKLHRTKRASIPANLVREIAPEILVAGPELCFVQMATTTSLVGAVVLGHELCGTYSHFARMASGFYERPALTSTDKISRAIQQLRGMRGLERAKSALRWMRDGSASPMETVVSCMLRLPVSMGGFGKQAPALNCVQRLDEAARRITGKKTCRVDSGYPEVKTGMEYDGKNYHRDSEKDMLRREALAHHGWTIYVVDVDEMHSYEELRKKVDLMGNVPQARGQGEPDEQKGRELLARLLRATRFGVGPNGTLFGVPVPNGRVRVHM